MDLRPVEVRADAIVEVTALLAVAFPDAHHIDARYVTWAYEENPEGAAVGFNAYEGDRLAAHYVTQPLRARVDGREERGLLSFHTATHPDFQGRGLFTQLAQRTFETAASSGYGHVIGVANAASTPGFVRKLGFQLVAPLDVRVGIGPAPAPAVSGAPGYERVWGNVPLSWRLACPARQYRLDPHDGVARAYAPTGRLGIWVELAALEASLATSALPALGWRPLRLWMGLDPSRRFASGAYVPVPQRLRPSPLNLIFLDLTGRDRRLDPGRARFRALDFDAY